MRLFALEPEVAGDWGPHTVVSNLPRVTSGKDLIPEVVHLDYRFNTWLGDELLQCVACYIISKSLMEAISQAQITGAFFDNVEISLDENMVDLYVNLALPMFYRLLPKGIVRMRLDGSIESWSGHDICWGERIDYKKPMSVEDIAIVPPPYSLVVTYHCLELFNHFQIENCIVVELLPPS